MAVHICSVRLFLTILPCRPPHTPTAPYPVITTGLGLAVSRRLRGAVQVLGCLRRTRRNLSAIPEPSEAVGGEAPRAIGVTIRVAAVVVVSHHIVVGMGALAAPLLAGLGNQNEAFGKVNPNNAFGKISNVVVTIRGPGICLVILSLFVDGVSLSCIIEYHIVSPQGTSLVLPCPGLLFGYNPLTMARITFVYRSVQRSVSQRGSPNIVNT